jgi:hypothetical protein
MRSKKMTTFLNSRILHSSSRLYGNVGGQYYGMVNIARACRAETEKLSKSLIAHKASPVLDAINDRLDALITYQSLKLTDGFSLTLEETMHLLKENKTIEGKNFFEQLQVLNHQRIVSYCRQYQKTLNEAGLGPSSLSKDAPDEYVLLGLSRLAKTFVSMFHEGLGGHFDVMYGGVHPAGALYFFDRPEYGHIKIGCGLLLQTIKQGAVEPFINAAKIHNEFARGHQFDKHFGLLFCRLHMNFALMLTGYSPAIIDSRQKEEYLKIVAGNKLEDPRPLAKFLVKNLKNTYEDYILPDLEAEAKNKSIPIIGLGSKSFNGIKLAEPLEADHSVKSRS